MQTRIERVALAHAKAATGNEKFLVASCYIDAKGMLQMKVDAQKWPMGDFPLVHDMLEDDFSKRIRAAAKKALTEKP